MVVPVPCRFALLLKLLTRMFPWTSNPVVVGTIATPYGFTSPLLGTVEATTLILPAACAWIANKETDAIVSRHRFLTKGVCIRRKVFIVFSWSVIAQGRVSFLPCQITAVAKYVACDWCRELSF